MTPYVVKQGSRTAIVLLELSDRIIAIPMADGPLAINSRFDLDDWTRMDYPVAKAAATYLAHHAGASPDAHRALNEIITRAKTDEAQQPPQKEPDMGIEADISNIAAALTRIADAQERLVDLAAGANLLLEAKVSTSQAEAEAEAAAAEVVEKAATRGRPRKKPEPAAEEPAVAAAEPASDQAAAAKEEPVAEAPAPAAEPVKTQPAAEAPAFNREQAIRALQKQAADKMAQLIRDGMSQDNARKAVVAVIEERGAGSVGKLSDESLQAMLADDDFAKVTAVADEF